jgi:hypothetical protein
VNTELENLWKNPSRWTMDIFCQEIRCYGDLNLLLLSSRKHYCKCQEDEVYLHVSSNGQHRNITAFRESFRNLAKLKYLGTAATNQKYSLEKHNILGNSCYHSVQNSFSSRLMCRKLETQICKTVILPIALHGCVTRSLRLQTDGAAEQRAGGTAWTSVTESDWRSEKSA